jgi:uncharacterized metal-binding protein YceD (DUF177 family)
MDCLDQYIIPFSGLDNDKEYNYSFIVEDSFFSNFEKSEIKGGDINVDVTLFKKPTSINIKIKLKGVVSIICDRCLDAYKQDIKFEDLILVVLSNETNFDTNEDFVTLDQNSGEINISQFIYEFAHFALPFTHYHPIDKNGNSTCNPEMLKILNDHSVKEPDNEIVDARWAKLIEIKNNINNH